MHYRRNARIKVMQALYGFSQDDFVPVKNLEKQLRDRFEESYQAYLYCLLVIKDVCEYTDTYADVQASKHLASESEKKASRRLAHSVFVEFLDRNESFKKAVKKTRLEKLSDEDLSRKIFYQLKDSPLYQRYANGEESEGVSDEEILQYLFEELMADSEDFENHIENLFPVWYDDKEIICFAVRESIHSICMRSFRFHDKFKSKLDDALEFARELLLKSIDHSEEYRELITPKLQNWDIERIAVMDLLLMRLALTEILNFPTIPVKVSMNEYIDISKNYSTPRSREFINGVLDKITKELKAGGKIYKEGPGLKEN